MRPWPIWIIFCLISLSIHPDNAEIIQEKSDNSSESNSREDELFSSNYVLPKQIFNDGKPFYVDKDPISGQLDFSSKKPAGIEPEINEVIDPKEKNIVLNNASPNFHDFLNLPVKYSSSKFVYPLVSSSYANLKYQGNNKNFISNHKNFSTTTTTTTSPKYYTSQKFNTTKLTKPTPTRPSTTTQRPVQVTTVAEKTTTRRKFMPTKKYTTTQKPTAQTTEAQPTTIRTTTQSTTTTRRSTTTRPMTSSVATTTARPTSTASPTTTTAKPPFSTTTTTTKAAEPSTTIRSTTAYSPTTTTRRSTYIPTAKTETTTAKPTKEPPFSPLPTSPSLSTLGPADVYNVVGQKKEPNTMSLADLFNVLADEDSSYSSSNQGLDKQGNLMQPISPSQPAPFTLQQVTKASSQPKQPPTQSPTHSKESTLQAAPEHDTNNYVRYEVKQPSVLQYRPVPSMNNIVISPGQHSASFVLGSQQSVGHGQQFVGTVEKEPLFQNGQHIQYGTVISEDITPAKLRPPQNQHQPASSEVKFADDSQNEQNIPYRPSSELQHSNLDQDTKDLFVSTNIRFPNDMLSMTSPTGNGPLDVINGHAQPIALPQSQPHPVSFPKNEKDWSHENQKEPDQSSSNVVFNQEKLLELPQKQEILTLNQHHHQNKVAFPQLPEDLTPPQAPELSRHPDNAPHPGSYRPHLPAPPAYMYNEFTRKSHSGPHRPNPDRPLPNILPQFRPNAKISNGHPSYSKEPGNMRPNHQKIPYPKRSLPPPFAHRRNPIYTNRYNFKPKSEPVESNRRVYTVPGPAQYPVDRMYLSRRPQVMNHVPPMRFIEGYGGDSSPVNRYGGDSGAASREMFNLPEASVKLDRLPAFEEEDFIVNDPPKPVLNKEIEPPKLEPVVTLQMLKSQKKTPEEGSNAEPVSSGVQNSDINQPPPVYVVYPVKTSPADMNMDLTGSDDFEDLPPNQYRGEQSAESQPSLDRSDINTFSSGIDYQNTPFSVIRDYQQEPILLVKNKSQTFSKANFPYPLEKPDPAFAEFSKQNDGDRFNRDTMIDISPRVVNRGSDDPYKSTDVPIAIAYTPTEPSSFFSGYSYDEKFSQPNLASPVIPEIRDTQTEAAINEEVDTRGQNFEKDFMAPFYPSISLSSVTNSPNGWSVYSASTEKSVYEKNSINRADVGGSVQTSEDATRKFDPDSFQPELQGGFKPIYPPGYKNKDSVEVESDAPSARIDNSSSTTSSSSTTTSTEKPAERKKSKFEASIEALLFGDDDDFEDDEEVEDTHTGTSS